jgi:hypothetical protein
MPKCVNLSTQAPPRLSMVYSNDCAAASGDTPAPGGGVGGLTTTRRRGGSHTWMRDASPPAAENRNEPPSRGSSSTSSKYLHISFGSVIAFHTSSAFAAISISCVCDLSSTITPP